MFVPFDEQVAAFTAMEQFILYGGSMGGGKSRLICELALDLSIKFPGNRGLIARQSFPTLKDTTMEVFLTETLPYKGSDWNNLGAKHYKQDQNIVFSALDPPSVISFRGLDRDNKEKIKSLNLGFFCLDEGTEIDVGIWDALCTRLRRRPNGKAIPPQYMKGLVTANPEPGWIKNKFIDRKLDNHRFIPSSFQSNPYLPENYASLFNGMSKAKRERWLYGDWGSIGGLIWSAFDPNFHIVPYEKPPNYWRFYRGLDHGQQNACACLGVASYYIDNKVKEILGDRLDKVDRRFDKYPIHFVYRLYYKPGLVSDHKEGIDRLFQDVENPGNTYCDPSIWRRDREKLVEDRKEDWSIADEYDTQPYAIRRLEKANNRVDLGIDRVQFMLEIGHLFFMNHPSLNPLIDEADGEIGKYTWKRPKNEDDDWDEQPVKRDDHACDALRYVMMAVEHPIPPPQPKIHPRSFTAIAEKIDAQRSRYKTPGLKQPGMR